MWQMRCAVERHPPVDGRRIRRVDVRSYERSIEEIMSNTAMGSDQDEHAERWQEWKRHNAATDRRSVIQARVVIALVLTTAAAWLALQLASSPAWS
jgi:hypothetical protein